MSAAHTVPDSTKNADSDSIGPACIKPGSLSLSDCLACSGCLTANEASEFMPDTSFLKTPEMPLSFIISPQVKRSLYTHFSSFSFEQFEHSLLEYLRSRFNTSYIIDTSYFHKGDTTGISSECPAVVLYVERQFPDLIPKLSTHKTYQQMAVEYLRKVLKDDKSKIVCVMQCYDKKEETRRDETRVDYFLGTKDFYETVCCDLKPSLDCKYQPLEWEYCRVASYPEVSGKVACINALNKARKNCEITSELRMCEGGCLKGPAQLAGEAPEVHLPENVEFCTYTSYSKRTFKKPAKRTFAVEW